jgi:2-iminobutanoate/2-iminopropanoate deaminase
VGPYSQAIVSNGFVFVSGCISLDMESGRIAEGGVGAEVRCALNNLRHVLLEAGVTDMSRVCKTTMMIREMAYFPEVNKIYGEYFKAEVKPARSTFEVSYLPLGAFIQVDAIAAL